MIGTRMELRKSSLTWSLPILAMVWFSRPVFAQQTNPSNGTMSYNIVEKLPPGVFVASIVNDAKLAETFDQNTINSLQFEVLKGAFKEYFTVESPNGLLKTRKIIDRDTLCFKQVLCSLPLDVAIIRPAQRFKIFKLEVILIDLNDNNPKFEPSTLTLSVPESALPGTVLVLPSAQDLDSGIFDIQNYSFTSNSSKFELQVTQNLDGTSDLRLLLKDRLDRELEDKHTATISAADGDSPPKTGNLEVVIMVHDANDNSPVFDKALYNVSIREDFPVNGVIVWVRATDADEGANSEVVYSFARQTEVAFGPIFSIDSARGDISLRQALDFERESVYTLLVVASDRGPDSVPVYAKAVITVEDLNDNAPVIRMNAVDSNGFAEVGEAEPILSFVAHISAEDADSGPNGEVNCELLQGSGFGLQMLYAKEFKLVTTTVFDREQADQYSVTILCHDNGVPPLSTSKDLVIRVTDTNDNAPEFDQKDYSATIREGNAQGAPILRVNATDADSGPNALVDYRLCPDAKGLVTIGNATGLMTANVVFDYEKLTQVQFCIVASDRGSPRLSSTAIVTLDVVDINDEAPAFGQPSYTFGTYENQPPNSEIGTVSANDADSPPYDKFVFSILRETPETNSFSIDPWTGRITTTVILDREMCVAHYLTIAATDVTFPNPSSTANVTIYVADKNDNAPHVEYPTRDNNTVEISSFSPIGYAFTRVFASDSDSGINAKLNYAIVKGNKDNTFDIDHVSGTVSVNRDLKELRESERKPFRLVISVSDSGLPPKSSEVTLNVIVSTSAALANLVQQTTSDLEFTSHKKILIIVGGITAVLVSILITSIVCIKWRQTVYNRKFRHYRSGREAATSRTEESRYLDISECYTAIKEGHQSKNVSPVHKSPQLQGNHNRKNVHFDLSLDPSDIITQPSEILSSDILKSKKKMFQRLIEAGASIPLSDGGKAPVPSARKARYSPYKTQKMFPSQAEIGGICLRILPISTPLDRRRSRQRSCNPQNRNQNIMPECIHRTIDVEMPIDVPDPNKSQVNHGPSLAVHDVVDSDSTSGCSTDMSNSDGGRGHCDCCAMNHHHHHHHHEFHSPVPGNSPATNNTHHQAAWVRSGPESDERSDGQLYEPVDDIQRCLVASCSGVVLPRCANCALHHLTDGSSSLHSPEHNYKEEAEEQCLLPPDPSSQINAHSENDTLNYISEINRQTGEHRLKRKPAVPPRNTSLKQK